MINLIKKYFKHFITSYYIVCLPKICKTNLNSILGLEIVEMVCAYYLQNDQFGNDKFNPKMFLNTVLRHIIAFIYQRYAKQIITAYLVWKYLEWPVRIIYKMTNSEMINLIQKRFKHFTTSNYNVCLPKICKTNLNSILCLEIVEMVCAYYLQNYQFGNDKFNPKMF